MTGAVSETSPYMPQPADILRVEPLTATETLYALNLSNGRCLGAMPGQFVELSLLGIGEAPFSIASAPDRGSGFELVIRKVGNVTRAVHKLKAGDQVGIRGPFGNPFPIEEVRGKDILFAAGGLGLVPLRSFIQYVLRHRSDYGDVTILFGARTPAERLFVDELSQWAARPHTRFAETVDRPAPGWTGHVGVITTLFPGLVIDPKRTWCVVVGPPVMYKFVILEARAKGIPNDRIFLSLERHMKCGLGKCGHCQINHFYVCRDGPVFRYSDIVDLKEAL